MKFSFQFTTLSLALLGHAGRTTDAFAPVGFSGASRQSTARSFSPMDPSNLHDIPNQIQSIQHAFSTLSIADLGTAGAVAADVVQSVDPSGAVGEVAEVASKNGWFGFLTAPTMQFLQLIHTGLMSVGLDSNSWGVSIIVLTLSIKLLTFPLTKAQLESTQKMQLLQPTLKETQAKYQSNPEVMNQKIAELYKDNNVNPLAGCIPSIVQIPVFIGLYRAVLDLANNNKLDEAFLWLPSLEGPVYGADPTKGSAWLFDNWVNGVPSLGWADTAKFLILPVVLVLSQFASMELMATPETKDSQPAFLKFLPLMIGWFSLNVPSALCVYWVTNNVVTTGTTVLIRNSLKNAAPVAMASASVADAVVTPPKSNVFTPSPTIREKPDGFASASSQARGSDGVAPITGNSAGAIDAEVVEDDSDDSAQASVSSEASTKKRGTKKKKKKRKN